jgi:hypothetical protein
MLLDKNNNEIAQPGWLRGRGFGIVVVIVMGEQRQDRLDVAFGVRVISRNE